MSNFAQRRQLRMKFDSCRDKDLLAALAGINERWKQRNQVLCWLRAGLRQASMPSKSDGSAANRGRKCHPEVIRIGLSSRDCSDIIVEWDMTPWRYRAAYFAELVRLGRGIIIQTYGKDVILREYLQGATKVSPASFTRTDEQVFLAAPDDRPQQSVAKFFDELEQWEAGSE